MTVKNDEVKKYFARYSSADDFDRLMAFYKANPHKNVDERNESLMRELVANGSVTMIQSAETGEVVAASISYPLNGDDGTQKWLEIGTTRSILNGYSGLFDIMIAMQVMRAYLVQPPSERFVCQMESPAVRKMADNLGFRPYIPSEELVRSSDSTLNADETCGYDKWYSAGPEALPTVAKRLLEAFDNGYVMPTEIVSTVNNVNLASLRHTIDSVTTRVSAKPSNDMKLGKFKLVTQFQNGKAGVKVQLQLNETINDKGEVSYSIVKADVSDCYGSKKRGKPAASGPNLVNKGTVADNGYNTLTHLKSGQKIEIDFIQSRFFKMFIDEIRELSKRDLGSVEQPDYKASISDNRQKWMMSFFN